MFKLLLVSVIALCTTALANETTERFLAASCGSLDNYEDCTASYECSSKCCNKYSKTCSTGSSSCDSSTTCPDDGDGVIAFLWYCICCVCLPCTCTILCCTIVGLLWVLVIGAACASVASLLAGVFVFLIAFSVPLAIAAVIIGALLCVLCCVGVGICIYFATKKKD